MVFAYARLISYSDMDQTKIGRLCGLNAHEWSGYKPTAITVHPPETLFLPQTILSIV
jgi:hypothetical protein